MQQFDTEFQIAQFTRFARLCERQSPPLVMILKAHLLAESLLDGFIGAFLRRGEHLVRRGRLLFAQKVTVFEATDYAPDSLSNALRTLNTIRNTLAHDAEADVSSADVLALCSCFHDHFQQPRYRSEPEDELLYIALVLTVGLLSHFTEEVITRKSEILEQQRNA